MVPECSTGSGESVCVTRRSGKLTGVTTVWLLWVESAVPSAAVALIVVRTEPAVAGAVTTIVAAYGRLLEISMAPSGQVTVPPAPFAAAPRSVQYEEDNVGTKVTPPSNCATMATLVARVGPPLRTPTSYSSGA